MLVEVRRYDRSKILLERNYDDLEDEYKPMFNSKFRSIFPSLWTKMVRHFFWRYLFSSDCPNEGDIFEIIDTTENIQKVVLLQFCSYNISVGARNI